MKAHQTDHRTSLRTRTWALVLAGALAVGGIAALSVRGAAADPVLPPLTPAELLGKVAAAQVDGLSATFEQRSDLGLPALPADLGDDSDCEQRPGHVDRNAHRPGLDRRSSRSRRWRWSTAPPRVP